MSNEQIKKYYLTAEEIDKFTKNKKVSSKQAIKLSRVNLGIKYVNLNSEEAIVFKLDYRIWDKVLAVEYSVNMEFLNNGVLYFLLDDNETIKIDKILEYIPNDYNMNSLIGRYAESLFLATDVATLIKLASAKKIEYRLTANGLGDSCEGELDYEESLKFKGFYNGVFDPEFLKEELTNHAVEGNKRAEEIEKSIEEDLKKSEVEEKKETQKINPNVSSSSSDEKPKNKLLFFIIPVVLIVGVLIYIIKNNKEDKPIITLEEEATPFEFAKPVKEAKPAEEVTLQKSEIEIKYYEINDPDGYSNLRETPAGNILRRVYLGEKFEVLDEMDRHKKVKFSNGETGYIHVSRVVESYNK
jgi:hypothetical protein